MLGLFTNGNLSLLQTDWGRFSFGYEACDQVQTVVDPGIVSPTLPGGATTLSYDARMLLSRQDNPNGTKSTLLYDANQRTLQIRHSTSAVVTVSNLDSRK